MARKSWLQRYKDHLASPYWKELKGKVVARRGDKCEMCKQTGVALDLHHKHYRTFGRERQKDVELLCRECHRIADKERAERGRIQRALVRVNSGVESSGDIELLSRTLWKESGMRTSQRS